MTITLHRRMPMATMELVEKNNVLIRMNKAKAYRELQRRQGRLLYRVWPESSSLSQSHDSSMRQKRMHTKSAVLESQNKQVMVESAGSIQSTLFTRRYHGSSMFDVNNNNNDDRQRSLCRSKVSPATRCLYVEPGRPVTAPETSAYATLDGPRQESVGVRFPKSNSVRSNESETGSLDGFKSSRHTMKRNLRASVDLMGQSIDCHNNQPFKIHNQSHQIGEAIQYPTASKMREMLANDGKISLEAVLAAEQGNRSIMKRGSQVPFTAKLSHIHNMSIDGNDTQVQVHNSRVSGQPHSTTTPSSIKRMQISSLNRKLSQGKQVSFVEGGDNSGGGKITPNNISNSLPEEQQLLALTTKNLNMYNAMVLKTLRTSKFDERIVQWVKERQCDQKCRLPKHDAIPEEDESLYTSGSIPNHGRATPNRTDYKGSSTPVEQPSQSESGRGIEAKPTVLSQVNQSENFSCRVDKSDGTKIAEQPRLTSPEQVQNTRENKPADDMSVVTGSDLKHSEKKLS